ncbi:hypothetical protein NLI96_g3222 [Meripilus lineatus]|uniref:Uncharacterized protein n=1 Tax=Meripilus lineatus TaxID=2056292 RepID=A0AAD5YFT6_9APHY|nr:hypothetical protein NLI96_g3222 [Physisporinus lineatus]
MFANIADFIVYFTALIYLSQFGFAAGLGFRLTVILSVMVLSPSVFLLGFLSLGFSLTLSCVLRLPLARYLATQVLVVVFTLPILVWNASVTLVLLSLEALVDMYHYPVFFVFGLVISWIIESIGLRNLRVVVSSLELDNISFRTLNTSLLRERKQFKRQLSSMRGALFGERRALVELQAKIVHIKERARVKYQTARDQCKAFADQNLTERMEHCVTQLKYDRTVEERDDILRTYRSLKRDSRERIQKLQDTQLENEQRIRDLELYVDKLKKEAGAHDKAHSTSKHSMSFTQIVSPLEQFGVSGEVEQVETSSVYSSALALDRTSEYTGFSEVGKEEVGAVESLRSVSIEASTVSTGWTPTAIHFIALC